MSFGDYLQTSSVTLTAFGGANIVSIGSISATVTVRGNTSTVQFIVTDTKSPNILSYEDSMKLKLIQHKLPLSLHCQIKILSLENTIWYLVMNLVLFQVHTQSN